MRRTILGTVAVLALLAGLAGRPASASDFTLYGAYQDTKDADQGFGVGGKLRFGIVDLRATYFDDVTTDTGRNDFELRMTPLEAGLAFKFASNDTVSPYAGGGAGYYFLKTNRGNVDDEVGYYAVLGTDITGHSGFGFNIEGIYRHMEATVTDRSLSNPDIQDKTKIQLGGLGVQAGLVWKF
jgi:outer membrane protein with beta-barrel domain